MKVLLYMSHAITGQNKCCDNEKPFHPQRFIVPFLYFDLQRSFH